MFARLLLSKLFVTWAVFVAAVCVFSIVGAINPDKLPQILNPLEIWWGVLGAFIGTGIALFIDWFRNYNNQIKALHRLRLQIQSNQELLKQLHHWFAHERGVPNFGLDGSTLNLWIQYSVGIIPGSLLSRLDQYRLQLDHINTRLLPIYTATMVLESSMEPKDGYPLYLGRAIHQTIDHIEIEFHAAENLLRLLERFESRKSIENEGRTDFQILKFAVKVELKL